MKTTGEVVGVTSNLVTVKVNGAVSQNEICYITMGNARLMAEVIKVNGDKASVQVFESTRGLRAGTPVHLSTNILSPESKAGSIEFEGILKEVKQNTCNTIQATKATQE